MKKNIEWLKKEVNELPLNFSGFSMLKQREEFTVNKDDVLELIDQLDEPEVLSQEWIDKNSVLGQFITNKVINFDKFVKADKLKNLLVPKQEEVEEGRVRLIVGFDGGTESYYATDIGDALDFLTDYDARFTVSKEPVIPKFVADWIDDNIERYDTVYSFIISLVEVFGDTVPEKVWTYASENPDTMARAYLDGYTVEEEQKYYVVDNEYIPLLQKGHGYVNRTSTGLSIFEKGRDNDQFALIEQEIKDYDERYWAFAKPVEELEE